MNVNVKVLHSKPYIGTLVLLLHIAFCKGLQVKTFRNWFKLKQCILFITYLLICEVSINYIRQINVVEWRTMKSHNYCYVCLLLTLVNEQHDAHAHTTLK